MSITNDKSKDQLQQLMEGYKHPTHTTEQKIFLQGDHIIRTQTAPPTQMDAPKKTLKLGSNVFASVKLQNAESTGTQQTQPTQSTQQPLPTINEKPTTSKPAAEFIPLVGTKASTNQSGTGYDKPKTTPLNPNVKPLSTAQQPFDSQKTGGFGNFGNFGSQFISQATSTSTSVANSNATTKTDVSSNANANANTFAAAGTVTIEKTKLKLKPKLKTGTEFVPGSVSTLTFDTISNKSDATDDSKKDVKQPATQPQKVEEKPKTDLKPKVEVETAKPKEDHAAKQDVAKTIESPKKVDTTKTAAPQLEVKQPAKEEAPNGVYSKEYIYKIFQRPESQDPLPEFEFYVRRRSEEQSKGQRTSFKPPTSKKNGPPQERMNVDDSRISRGNRDRRPAEEAKTPSHQNVGGISRLEMSQEDIDARNRILTSVNKWGQGIKNKTPEELLENRIRFQLNILTPDNYETVKSEIKTICEEGKTGTEKVGDILIEKAWTEINYCRTYAKLCDFLGKNEKLFFDEGKQKNYYKTYIIKKIQTVFDDESQMKMRAQKSMEEMTKEEKESFYMKKKKRILGNVTFIGELLLVKFIPIRVITYCTTTLLIKYFTELAEQRTTTPDGADMKNHEDHLDGLIKLYEIVGRNYEEKGMKDEKSRSNSISAQIEEACEKAEKGELDFVIDANFDMDELFGGLQVLLNKAPLTVRLKSLIMNLEYRRRNNWQAPDHANQGPKTLRAIHEEYEREFEEIEKRGQDYMEGEMYNNARKKESRPTYIYQEKKETHSAFSSNMPTANKFNDLAKLQPEVDDTKTEGNKKYNYVQQEFKPQRGSRTQTDSSAKKTIPLEKCVDDFKEIYKKLESSSEPEGEEEDRKEKQSAETMLKNLAEKSQGQEFVRAFLSTFADGRQSTVVERIKHMQTALNKNFITLEDFNRGFGEALAGLWSEASDFPGIENNYAHILLLALQKGFKAVDLYIPSEVEQSDEKEYIFVTYKDVLGYAVDRINNGEFADLKGSKKDIDELLNKLKV